MEETGLAVDLFLAVDTWQGTAPERYGDRPIISVTYLCRAPSLAVVVSPTEHSEFFWVALKDFDTCPLFTGEFNRKAIAAHVHRNRNYL
jgi:hypothetical protein